MGFRYNCQPQIVLSSRLATYPNKSKRPPKPESIYKPNLRCEGRLPRLSTRDYKFLQFIGLKVRKQSK